MPASSYGLLAASSKALAVLLFRSFEFATESRLLPVLGTVSMQTDDPRIEPPLSKRELAYQCAGSAPPCALKWQPGVVSVRAPLCLCLRIAWRLTCQSNRSALLYSAQRILVGPWQAAALPDTRLRGSRGSARLPCAAPRHELTLQSTPACVFLKRVSLQEPSQAHQAPPQTFSISLHCSVSPLKSSSCCV